MKCYSYIRVSGKSQVDKDGFPRQRAACEAWAAVNGAEIVKEFREKGVGGDAEWEKRPAFEDMLGAIMGNGVHTIIVENLTRLARAFVVQDTLLTYLVSKDITLISADSGENITEAVNGDPIRRAMVQIQAVFSELEKATLVRKLRAARQRRRAEGGGWTEGRKAFGFRPGEKDTIAIMRRFRSKKMSLAQVARALDAAGRPSRSGKPWSGESVRKILKRKAS